MEILKFEKNDEFLLFVFRKEFFFFVVCWVTGEMFWCDVSVD